MWKNGDAAQSAAGNGGVMEMRQQAQRELRRGGKDGRVFGEA